MSLTPSFKAELHAQDVETLMRKVPDNPKQTEKVRDAVTEIARTRFVTREPLDGLRRYEKREKKVIKSKWKLATSIWAPRVKWCDSKDFYDSEATSKAMLEHDYQRAVDVTLGAYIERHDDGESTHEGGEVGEVYDVLNLHRTLIYVLFDLYACMGSSEDIFHIQLNAFTSFVGDFKLVDKKNKYVLHRLRPALHLC